MSAHSLKRNAENTDDTEECIETRVGREYLHLHILEGTMVEMKPKIAAVKKYLTCQIFSQLMR